MVENVFR